MTETRRHFEVVGEALRGEICQVAKGITDSEERLQGGLKGLGEERIAGFSEIKSMTKFSHTELDRRVSASEKRLTARGGSRWARCRASSASITNRATHEHSRKESGASVAGEFREGR